MKPVIDLAEHIHVGAYEVPDRLAEQTQLRDHTCAFPWCERPARACEKDHVIPHARGGPTCTENLAPLCKRHHRLKTHHCGWTYTVLEPGTYLWTSPTATSSSATTPAPSTCHRETPAATGHHPTTSPTAPHPADPTPRRGHRHACSRHPDDREQPQRWPAGTLVR